MSHRIDIGRLDAHQFKCLWTLFPDDPWLIATAAQDTLMYESTLKARNIKGVSGDGRRVTTDRVGAYSSGYITLDTNSGNGYVEWPKGEIFTWDDDPEENRRKDIRTKLAELRDA